MFIFTVLSFGLSSAPSFLFFLFNFFYSLLTLKGFGYYIVPFIWMMDHTYSGPNLFPVCLPSATTVDKTEKDLENCGDDCESSVLSIIQNVANLILLSSISPPHIR